MSIDDICYEELQFEKVVDTAEALIYAENLGGVGDKKMIAWYVGEIEGKDNLGAVELNEEARKKLAKQPINIIFTGKYNDYRTCLQAILKTINAYKEGIIPDEPIPKEEFSTTITRLTYSLYDAIQTGNYEKEMAVLVEYTRGRQYTDDIYRLIAHMFSREPEKQIIDTLLNKIIAREQGDLDTADEINATLPEAIRKLPATAT